MSFVISTFIAHRPEAARPSFHVNVGISSVPVVTYMILAVLYTIGHNRLQQLDKYIRTVILFVWVVGLILASAMQVMRHRETLAEMPGKPFEILILIISAISIETSLIIVVMLSGAANPILVRDTIFSELMIFLCLMVGASLLLGGIRHRQQIYNLDAARSFLSGLFPIAIIIFVMPNYVGPTVGSTLSYGQAAQVGILIFTIYLIFSRCRPSGRRRCSPNHPKTAHPKHRARWRQRCDPGTARLRSAPASCCF
jgi:Ca2+:H+ antiporter